MKKIPLTQGKVTLVNDFDFTWLNQVKWYAKKASCKWYAARGIRTNGHTITIYMHRAIMAGNLDHTDLDGKEVDHENRNSLDNQRENLIVCTKKENLRNRNWKTQVY